jgi:PAS domain S-box-containing protein
MLEEILAIAADALVVIDREHRVVLFSPGAESIFGFRADEDVGESIDMLLPEAVRRVHREHVRGFEQSSVASRLMGERGRIHGLRSDGTEFPAEASISRIEVEGERYYAAVVRDATDRDRAEQELRRSQSELSEAQRLAHVGSWEWEIEADVARWSDELHRIFGREPDGVLGYADILDHVHPDDRAAANASVEEALRHGTFFQSTFRILRMDGSVRLLLTRGRVIRDGGGKAVRMLGTVQDVTTQHEAEEHARELLRQQTASEVAQAAAARFRFLAEASQILGSSLAIEETLRSVTRLTVPGIADWCSLDLIGDKGELRRVEVAHVDPEKVKIAHEIHRRFPPDTAIPAASAALLRGEPLLIEDFSEAVVLAAARDPEHRELLRSLQFRSAMCVPLLARDRLVGLITLATAESGRSFGPEDVSLVRSLADRAAVAIDNARLFEQAKAAASAREEAVATVSHDLRSPLGVMSMSVALLQDPELPAAERTHALERMKRAADGMERMINDLLDVTRLEAGAVALRCTGCDAEALVLDACDLEYARAKARGVQLDVEVESGLRVVADADRIIQVLTNLLNNAVRHSPAGGHVRVSVQLHGRDAVFAVVDQGTGVPKELRDRIFQRFWQSESRQSGAAGLGLAIARALVELHGGRIWAEDAPGGGARFCFTLTRES